MMASKDIGGTQTPRLVDISVTPQIFISKEIAEKNEPQLGQLARY